MQITIKSPQRVVLINITEQIQSFLKTHISPDYDGTLNLFVPHTTAAITINETADPSVCRDLEEAFKKLVPSIKFQHAEGNSPAHFLSSIIGPDLTVPIKNGRLQLGTWQGIIFCEFDGPRNRHLHLST